MNLTQIQFFIEKRTIANWRHILTTPEIDYCTAMKHGNLLPHVGKAVEIMRRDWNFPSQLCPVKPGKYYAMDIMIYSDARNDYNSSVPEKLNPNNAIGIELPNGKYRLAFRASTSTDPYVFMVQWHLEVRHRLMENDFK